MAGSRGTVIGLLDATTRLTSTQHSFNIEEKCSRKAEDGAVQEVWVARYFYSTISSALRGYAKYKAKKMGIDVAKNGTLSDILALVTLLDKTIKDVGVRLEEGWRTASAYDPIEAACEDSK